MSEKLDRLAESHGIALDYVSEQGEKQVITDHAKEALLKALGVDARGGEEGSFEAEDKPSRHCLVPDDLKERGAWGISCQLYALRSRRCLGIGDFEDLATLAGIGAEAGADFVGVNPLHAMFLAEPERCSPYSPSSRRFLSPLYLAVDKIGGGEEALRERRQREPAAFAKLDGDLVDYGSVGRLKRDILWEVFQQRFDELEADASFARFREAAGEALGEFALFEALSLHMAAEGHHAGWHSWPEEYRDRSSEAVQRFAETQRKAIRFHEWLQYEAEEQLARAHASAKEAGMRVGLYLDLAVGVAPDGAETWSDPALTVSAARVGAPPDMFNTDGQDWGLAPLSPKVLAERNFEPLAVAFDGLMRNAGALRIDHAMGLARLWWIPESERSAGGGYVRYPIGKMIDMVAEASQANRCVVIGEDLGTVPPGFRGTMTEAGILSYRVLYFERKEGAGFVSPGEYPALALACISTHDLPTLTGWWRALDVELRSQTGRQNEANSERDRKDRQRDRQSLLAALKQEGLLPAALEGAASGGEPLPGDMSGELAAAVHRFVARTPSMLVVAQIDDMIGSDKQPNLPGTTEEYPNWRLRYPVLLEELSRHERFQAIAAAMRDERPQQP